MSLASAETVVKALDTIDPALARAETYAVDDDGDDDGVVDDFALVKRTFFRRAVEEHPDKAATRPRSRDCMNRACETSRVSFVRSLTVSRGVRAVVGIEESERLCAAARRSRRRFATRRARRAKRR